MDAVLYTHTCADGFGSAVVFAEALGIEYPDVRYSSYAGLLTHIEELVSGGRKDVVVIADMHPTAGLMLELDKWRKELNVRLLLYDHHKSASKFATEYGWVHFDDSMCSAKSMLHRLSNDVLLPWDPDPKTVETVLKVDAWDMWLLSDRYREGGEGIARYVDLVGVQQAVTDYLTNNEFMFDPQLARLLGRVETRETGLTAAGLRLFIIGDVKPVSVGVMYKESARFGFGTVSDLAFDLYPDLDYVVIVRALEGAVTIRSNRYNALDLVLQLGGGGNPRSAGFPLTRPVTISRAWEEQLVSSIFTEANVRFYGIPG